MPYLALTDDELQDTLHDLYEAAEFYEQQASVLDKNSDPAAPVAAALAARLRRQALDTRERADNFAQRVTQ